MHPFSQEQDSQTRGDHVAKDLLKGVHIGTTDANCLRVGVMHLMNVFIEERCVQDPMSNTKTNVFNVYEKGCLPCNCCHIRQVFNRDTMIQLKTTSASKRICNCDKYDGLVEKKERNGLPQQLPPCFSIFDPRPSLSFEHLVLLEERVVQAIDCAIDQIR